MPVATLLAIAATFWSTHGYPTTAIPGWDWDTQTCTTLTAAGCANVGAGGPIHLRRTAWDDMTATQKCVLVVHEYGHAVLGFWHTPGTIMDETSDMYAYAPSLCTQLERNPRPDPAPTRAKRRVYR